MFLGLGWNKIQSNRPSFHYLIILMVLGRRSNTFIDLNDPRALLHVQNNNHHQTAATPLEQSQTGKGCTSRFPTVLRGPKPNLARPACFYKILALIAQSNVTHSYD